MLNLTKKEQKILALLMFLLLTGLAVKTYRMANSAPEREQANETEQSLTEE